MDEAASRLRIEIDSMPTELDVVIRRIRQLEIEQVALEKETDAASRERLARLEEELADQARASDALAARWQAEKQAIERDPQRQGRVRGPARRGRAPRARGRPGGRGRRCATATLPELEGPSSARPRSSPTSSATAPS